MQLSGSANGMWEDETTDRRGAPCWTSSATARAFLEAQLRQQHNMAQDLKQKQTKHKSRGHGMSL